MVTPIVITKPNITSLRIGIISDTHGHWDQQAERFFKECKIIFHAGDIGNTDTAQQINAFRPLHAVTGNIDPTALRELYPEILTADLLGNTIYMRHIIGHPDRYNAKSIHDIQLHRPNILICGHSHILRVSHSKRYNLLHINPGAYGKTGIHRVRTAIRITLTPQGPKDLEVLELDR